MKLKKKTDYTLRTLIFIINSDKRSKIQEISDYYKISKNHLKVIVNQLSTLEIIFSYSGPNGGIEINPEKLDYPLGDLVKILEEDLNLVECFSNAGGCVIDSSCKLKGILKKAANTFLDELNQYTIRDLRN
ncbi:Rrf2 family transcriptional regulator [bacterium]|nr:Rrf2 family transcriptional regulator [bacterium]